MKKYKITIRFPGLGTFQYPIVLREAAAFGVRAVKIDGCWCIVEEGVAPFTEEAIERYKKTVVEDWWCLWGIRAELDFKTN